MLIRRFADTCFGLLTGSDRPRTSVNTQYDPPFRRRSLVVDLFSSTPRSADESLRPRSLGRYIGRYQVYLIISTKSGSQNSRILDDFFISHVDKSPR